jgi:hypothetical protein
MASSTFFLPPFLFIATCSVLLCIIWCTTVSVCTILYTPVFVQKSLII